ncbi:hypothetical protein DFH08DRAFT_751560 [Mycena albidolilacea]|uniref:F-box domain-containing protein n=1 Tax=Mycena albidolilacea TaxID=1033008 RepID=A0AAD6ZNS4_9AGAR|nr:hypothetical protein DFH08DRAFT_751560 [Mycena albidolilacea]
MSVQELRARIEEISSEIHLQPQFSKKLEHDKSLIQRQLNDVVDPVSRLPLQVSSKIFLRCLPPLERSEAGYRHILRVPNATHAPILLLNVCNSWTDIALATPALWTAINSGFPWPKGFDELLQAWFQRARNHPLSVSIRPSSPEIKPILWRCGQQLKHLEIESGEDVAGLGQIFDLFGPSPPHQLSILETLNICGSSWGRNFSGPQILALLGLAPNLVECIFFGISLSDIPAERFVLTRTLVLAALRRLQFGDPERPHWTCDASILKCLSPAVEDLSISFRDPASQPPHPDYPHRPRARVTCRFLAMPPRCSPSALQPPQSRPHLRAARDVPGAH